MTTHGSAYMPEVLDGVPRAVERGDRRIDVVDQARQSDVAPRDGALRRPFRANRPGERWNGLQPLDVGQDAQDEEVIQQHRPGHEHRESGDGGAPQEERERDRAGQDQEHGDRVRGGDPVVAGREIDEDEHTSGGKAGGDAGQTDPHRPIVEAEACADQRVGDERGGGRHDREDVEILLARREGEPDDDHADPDPQQPAEAARRIGRLAAREPGGDDHRREQRRPGQQEVGEEHAGEEPRRPPAGHRAREAADVLADEELGDVLPAVRVGEADGDHHGAAIARTISAPGTIISRRRSPRRRSTASHARATAPGSSTRHRPFRQHAEADRHVHQQQVAPSPRLVAHRQHEARERQRHERRDVDVDENAAREEDDPRRGGDEERGNHTGRRRSQRPSDQERREDDRHRADRDAPRVRRRPTRRTAWYRPATIQ